MKNPKICRKPLWPKTNSRSNEQNVAKEPTVSALPRKTRKRTLKYIVESSAESEDYGSNFVPPPSPVIQFCKKLAKKFKSEKKNTENDESWYCFLCNQDAKIAMRACIACKTYAHESCIELESDDEDAFVCPDCT